MQLNSSSGFLASTVLSLFLAGGHSGFAADFSVGAASSRAGLPNATALKGSLAAPAQTHIVEFSDLKFVPAQLTINQGDSVEFRNKGGFHTVTGPSDNDPFCGQDAIETSCSVVFPTAGTFDYRCRFHSSLPPNAQGMVGSITVLPQQGDKPNLRPFLRQAWTDIIVASTQILSTTDDNPIFEDEEIFVDWAIANVSTTAAIAPRFFTELDVDGQFFLSWFHDGLTADTFNSIQDQSIGKLSPGQHTLRILTDHTAVVEESDETDNAYEKIITVSPRPLVKSYTVLLTDNEFSPTVLNVLAGDTVNFSRLEGSHTVTGTDVIDTFCGPNAVPTSCPRVFNVPGDFAYRCVFHSSPPPNVQGMKGLVRVFPRDFLQSSSSVAGPYLQDSGAVMHLINTSIEVPLPAQDRFYRLRPDLQRRVTSLSVAGSKLQIQFE